MEATKQECTKCGSTDGGFYFNKSTGRTRAECIPCDKKQAKIDYFANAEKRIAQRIKNYKQNRKRDQEKSKLRGRQYRIRAMTKVGRLECARDCGETRVQALDLHHLNKQGARDRKKFGCGGVYRAIIRGDLNITDFENLCASCHAVETRK